jgi:isoleucyl-tRNA synthetase
MSGEASVSILPWTTTPWTLPANMFAAVHRDIDYIQLFDKSSKEYYVLAEACLSKYYKTANDYIEVGVFKGTELIGMSYSPLYSYYHDAAFDDSYKAQVHTILHADFVTTESGTGIVHEAPAFGADDYDLVASHL